MPLTWRTCRTLFSASVSSLRVFNLATVPPGDDQSEDEVEPAKTSRHAAIRPAGWQPERCYPKRHKAETHERDDAYGECSAGYDSGSIKEQPHSRQVVH